MGWSVNWRIGKRRGRRRPHSSAIGQHLAQSSLEGPQVGNDIQQLLLDAGFRWVSSKYPPHANSEAMKEPSADVYADIVAKQKEAQPFVYPTGLIEIPMNPISDIGAFRTGRWELEWFLEAIERCVNWAIENKAVFDFLAHPSCLGYRDPDFRAVELICSLVKNSQGKAQLATMDEIAETVV